MNISISIFYYVGVLGIQRNAVLFNEPIREHDLCLNVLCKPFL